jgi:D-alanyl-D-alanine carboxypeptidase (penicillin-binding protein 5/6)
MWKVRPLALLAVPALAFSLAAAPAAGLAPPYRSAIVMDPASGEVLHEYRADHAYPTASMVKMMTLLVVMDHVDSGDVAWDQPIEVSARSTLVGGSQVYLKEGEVFPLSELVAAVMIKSANDAAHLLAESVGGSVEAFVAEMNEQGRELRLDNSRFYTPHGLPPEKPGQHDDVMSARDLAVVGARVLRDPRLRDLAATESRPFRDGEFLLRSSNHLLRRWDEAIGIKTGWTSTADFCLTAAARRHGLELVAVVQGAERNEDSFGSARRLLEEGFARYRLVTLAEAGDRLPWGAAVAGGERQEVPVVALEPARLLVREGTPVQARPVVLSHRLEAPVEAGQPVGFAVYRCGARLARIEVAAAEAVAPQPWWERLWRRVVSLVAATAPAAGPLPVLRVC